MKKQFFTVFFSFALYALQAQEVKDSEVPDAVKSAFKKQFPTAKVEKWEKENDAYEAEFHFNKTETSAMFSSGGKYLGTETEIPLSELPAGINTYISTQLAGKKATVASRITDNKGLVTYEAEINGTDYLFDANGAFLKTENDEKKDSDKD